jgi:hypothetical protein
MLATINSLEASISPYSIRDRRIRHGRDENPEIMRNPVAIEATFKL